MGKDIFSNEFYSLTDQVDGIDEITVVPANIQAIDLNKFLQWGLYHLWKQISRSVL